MLLGLGVTKLDAIRFRPTQKQIIIAKYIPYDDDIRLDNETVIAKITKAVEIGKHVNGHILNANLTMVEKILKDPNTVFRFVDGHLMIRNRE